MVDKRRASVVTEKDLAMKKSPRLKQTTLDTKTRPISSAQKDVKVIQADDSKATTRLFLSIDYGTKTLSLAHRFLKPGEKPTFDNVRTLELSRGRAYAPQIAVWAKDGTFYWGHELATILKLGQKEGEFDRDEVIELWKLLLYKEHSQSALVKRITAQLKAQGKTLQQLISTHLAAIVQAAKERLKGSANLANFEFTLQELDDMEVDVFLSVPQMWEAPANREMTEAAQTAGINYVELVYEPQCAAAYWALSVNNDPRQLAKGDVLIIADIGGGTGDFVSYEFGNHGSFGAKMCLATVEKPEGALCGSQYVNENFLTWFVAEAARRAKTFKAFCERYDLTQIGCLKKAESDFETLKKDFEAPKTSSDYIIFRGSGCQEAVFEISSKAMKAFFEPVIANICKCIDNQIEDVKNRKKTKALIIPGGFGNSLYLVSRLEKKYAKRFLVMGQEEPPVGRKLTKPKRNEPVSRGALLRYDDIEYRGLSGTECFGIGRTEEFDPKVHQDLTVKSLPKLRGGSIPDRRKIKEDPYWGTLSVHQRWVPITKKATSGRDTMLVTDTWREDWVSPEDDHLETQIYWTKHDMKAHDPIMEGGLEASDGDLRPHIHKWGRPLIKKLPDLKALRFELQELPSGEQYFVVHSRLLLQCHGANIDVMWQIAKPESKLYDEDHLWNPSGNVELAEDQLYELMDASYNPNPRSSPS